MGGGEVEDGFPDCVAGNSDRVDTAAPEGGYFWDQRNALFQLRALDGGPLSSRAGADHDEIVGLHAWLNNLSKRISDFGFRVICEGRRCSPRTADRPKSDIRNPTSLTL